jgi:hypothetical protein
MFGIGSTSRGRLPLRTAISRFQAGARKPYSRNPTSRTNSRIAALSANTSERIVSTPSSAKSFAQAQRSTGTTVSRPKKLLRKMMCICADGIFGWARSTQT